MKVLAIGRSEYLFNAIESLSKRHKVVAIVTGSATAESKAKESDFCELAARLGSRYKFAKTIDEELIGFCREAGADVAISVNWMSVIRKEFIDLFPHGVLNAHCGDLPAYRGNAILNWAILRGEKQIIVSAHKMIAGELDVGDIYAQRSFEIHNDDDVGCLVRKMGDITPHLFEEALHNLEQSRCLRRYSEMLTGGFRCYPRLPVDGGIDWCNSAVDIHRLVRASARPYPGAFSCVLHEGRLRKLYIWKSRVVCESTRDVGVPGHVVANDRVSGETLVLTGSGVLALQEVQLDSDSPLRPADVFKSIRMRLGLSEALLIDLMTHPSVSPELSYSPTGSLDN